MSREASIPKRFASEHAVALAAIVAGVVAVAQSWMRWLHPYIDAGRDLYIPEQLRHGTVLYRDVLYFYPPLTPYLLATLHVSSLVSYAILGLAIAALTALAMWRIARPLAGAHAAGAALLLFFALNMCGAGGWGSNYFFPYAHAATLAMLFWSAAASLPLSRAAALPPLSIALLILAACTKIEFVVFGAALIALRGTWRSLVAYLAIIGALLAIVLSSPLLRANILPPSLLHGASAQFFYAQVSGVANWRTNLMLSAAGALLIALVALLLRYFEKQRVLVAIAAVVCAVALANPIFFRAWTILQLALIPFALRRPRSPLALLLLLSLCGSSRIWLNLAPSWYGFVFTVPLEVLMVYVLFAWLPERGVYSARAAKLWLVVFAAVAISGLYAANRAYASAEPVVTKRGTYYDVSSSRAASVRSLLEHLERVQAKELVVMPEGLAINYLAGIRTPLRYQTFTPVEIAGDESLVLRELMAKKPERVAIVPRDVRELGYRGFGNDYGRDIVTWLRANYAVEARCGEIVLLRKRT